MHMMVVSENYRSKHLFDMLYTLPMATNNGVLTHVYDASRRVTRSGPHTTDHTQRVQFNNKVRDNGCLSAAVISDELMPVYTTGKWTKRTHEMTRI